MAHEGVKRKQLEAAKEQAKKKYPFLFKSYYVHHFSPSLTPVLISGTSLFTGKDQRILRDTRDRFWSDLRITKNESCFTGASVTVIPPEIVDACGIRDMIDYRNRSLTML